MPRQYTPEFRQRALRMLDATLEGQQDVSESEAIRSVAAKLGVAEETFVDRLLG
jgi:transposase